MSVYPPSSNARTPIPCAVVWAGEKKIRKRVISCFACVLVDARHSSSSLHQKFSDFSSPFIFLFSFFFFFFLFSFFSLFFFFEFVHIFFFEGKSVTALSGSVLHTADSNRRNAMHYAAAKNDVMSLADLCDQGVSCSLQDMRGQSPLHYAVLHGAHAALQTLLEMPGMLVNAQNEEGCSPLWMAAQQGDAQAVALLLAAGANPNIGNIEEASPLHIAAASGHTAVVKLLLAAGAFVNATDGAGDTPLHWAVREEQSETAKILASAFGVNLKAKNEDGETAAELARACGLPHMEAVIVTAKSNLMRP